MHRFMPTPPTTPPPLPHHSSHHFPNHFPQHFPSTSHYHTHHPHHSPLLLLRSPITPPTGCRLHRRYGFFLFVFLSTLICRRLFLSVSFSLCLSLSLSVSMSVSVSLCVCASSSVCVSSFRNPEHGLRCESGLGFVDRSVEGVIHRHLAIN